MKFRLALDSLCSPCWPQIHSNPPARPPECWDQICVPPWSACVLQERQGKTVLPHEIPLVAPTGKDTLVPPSIETRAALMHCWTDERWGRKKTSGSVFGEQVPAFHCGSDDPHQSPMYHPAYHLLVEGDNHSSSASPSCLRRCCDVPLDSRILSHIMQTMLAAQRWTSLLGLVLQSSDSGILFFAIIKNFLGLGI